VALFCQNGGAEFLRWLCFADTTPGLVEYFCGSVTGGDFLEHHGNGAAFKNDGV
jgi:hypothetical protein